MVDLKLNLSETFYKEETRCGYTVTEKMKKVWAIQLDMLMELDRVCQKYDLTYFADSGTLIGAVRHKGFIPWDDDIDVAMMRKDYEKLLSVAEKEFQYPLFLQTTYSDKMYVRAHAQLRNCETTGCIQADVEKPFNKGIFIDIFVLDNIPDDPKELLKFKRRINIFWIILGFVFYDSSQVHGWKGHILGHCVKALLLFTNYKKLFEKYEKLCSSYNDRETKCVSYIAYSRGKEKHIWKKEWFIESYRVPFEETDIVIPIGYDERLRKEYGEYMVMQKAPTAHGDVILEPDIPYRKYFEEGKSVEVENR